MGEPTITSWLCVSLGDGVYGLEAGRVREIAVLDQATRTPGAPSWVIGATNLRGSILPLVDLGALLGLREATPWTTVQSGVTAIWEGEVAGVVSMIGLVVDAVSDLLEVPESAIEKAPEFGTEIAAELVLGLARTNDRYALLVDVAKALRTAR